METLESAKPVGTSTCSTGSSNGSADRDSGRDKKAHRARTAAAAPRGRGRLPGSVVGCSGGAAMVAESLGNTSQVHQRQVMEFPMGLRCWESAVEISCACKPLMFEGKGGAQLVSGVTTNHPNAIGN